MKAMLGARVTTGAAASSRLPAAAATGGSPPLLLSRGRLLVANVAVPSRPPTAHTARRSKVEIIKEQSDYLRHPLMEVCSWPEAVVRGVCQSASCSFSVSSPPSSRPARAPLQDTTAVLE